LSRIKLSNFAILGDFLKMGILDIGAKKPVLAINFGGRKSIPNGRRGNKKATYQKAKRLEFVYVQRSGFDYSGSVKRDGE
jgi:hypothetical protein